MPDKRQSTRLVCMGGLDSTKNHLQLSLTKPGAATNLVNYEVGLTGGYRRINGYQPLDATYPEVTGEGKILTVAIFENSTTGATEFIAARKDESASTYSFYKLVSGTGWVAYTTGLTLNYTSGSLTVDKIRHDTTNNGTINVIAFADGVNPATYYDGTNWYSITSTATGADWTNAGGNQVVDAPSLVCFFSKTLFLAGDAAYPGVVTFSAPDKFYDFTAASGGGQLIPGLSVVQMKPFRKDLYIFGRNGIRKASANVDAGFVTEYITDNIGAIAADAVMEIGGDIVFLAPDGFRPVAGTDKIGDVQLETISKAAQNFITRKIGNNPNLHVNSVVIRGKSQFRVFIGDDAYEQADATGIIGCLRTPDQETGWEFSEIRGFRASCADSKYVLGTEYVIHGDYDGYVYQQEQGSSRNGANLISIYETPFLDFGDTEVRKVIEKINMFFNVEGAIKVSMGVRYDWGNPNVTYPDNYNIENTNTVVTYDSGEVYDGGAQYGGTVFPLTNTDVQGSFFSVQFTFTTSGTEAPHSVHGFVVEYAVEGRR